MKMSSQTLTYVRSGFIDLIAKIVARKDREKQSIDQLYRDCHEHIRTKLTQLQQKIETLEEQAFAELKAFTEQEKTNGNEKIHQLECLLSGVTREQKLCRITDMKEESILHLKSQLENDQETFRALDTNMKSYRLQECKHFSDFIGDCTSLFDFKVIENNISCPEKECKCEEKVESGRESAASGYVSVDSGRQSSVSAASSNKHKGKSERIDGAAGEVDQDKHLFRNLNLAKKFSITEDRDCGSLEALGSFKNGILVAIDTKGRQQYTFNENYSQIRKITYKEYQQDISFVDGTDIMVSTAVQTNKKCILKVANVLASGKRFRTISPNIEYHCSCKVHCVSAQQLHNTKILACILCPKEVRVYTLTREGRKPKNVNNFQISSSEDLESQAFNESRYNIQLSKEADFFYYIKDMEQVVCREVEDPSIVKWEFSRNGFRPGNICLHGDNLLITNNFGNSISVLRCQSGLEVQEIDLEKVDPDIVNPFAIAMSHIKSEMFLTQYSPDLGYMKKKLIYCISFEIH